MSHFTVLVIGDNPEKKLAPYDENMAVEPYKDYMSNEDKKRMAEHYKIEPSDTDAIIAHMGEWSGRDGQFDDNGIYYMNTYNPKSKWDWFQVGGRWMGQLVLKEGREGNYGDPSWSYRLNEHGKEALLNMVKRHEVSQAKAGDVDWEATYAGTMEERQAFEEEWEWAVNGIEPADKKGKFIFYKPEYYTERYHTKEEFVKRSIAFHTYAVVTEDGEWHSSGDMGWFGMSSETDKALEDWHKNYFARFIKDLEPETLVTIVDCHI